MLKPKRLRKGDTVAMHIQPVQVHASLFRTGPMYGRGIVKRVDHDREIVVVPVYNWWDSTPGKIEDVEFDYSDVHLIERGRSEKMTRRKYRNRNKQRIRRRR